MQDRETAQWKLAALLKDRTRREIRSRALLHGEAPESIAADFGVPVQFVRHLSAWQLAADEPAPIPPPVEPTPEPDTPADPLAPRKPGVNLMDALRKSLESLDRTKNVPSEER